MSSPRWVVTVAFFAGVFGLALLTWTDTFLLALVGAAIFLAAVLVVVRTLWLVAETSRRDAVDRFRALAESLLEAKQSIQSVSHERSDTDGTDGLVARIDSVSDGMFTELTRLQTQLGDHDSGLKRQLEYAAKHRDKAIEQLDGIISLYSTFSPTRPYPKFGNAAIAGDSARAYVSMIFEFEPRMIIELGSGLSTVLSAKALDLIGGPGQVVSLDHDEGWAVATRTALKQQGLDDRATVHHAPLAEVIIDSEPWKWYDLREIEMPLGAQIMFVDGPPKSASGPLGRYPALPMLIDHLADDAIILLDDGNRPGETEVVDRWVRQIPDLVVKRHKDSKGTIELIRGAGLDDQRHS